MKTLEMIQDWKESNYKKKYIKIENSKLPYTVYNNGVDVLFCSYFKITINDPKKESGAFIISKDNLEWDWKEIKEEYDIKQAIEKTKNGDIMISLSSSKILDLKDKFSSEEIMSKWIEKY